MADTYAKLLGLSEPTSPATDSGASPPASKPQDQAKKTQKLANQQTSNKGVPADRPQPAAPTAPVPAPPHPRDSSLLTTKEKTKYGTYLTDESIQKIRIRAAETNKADHQVLQEIINQYFEKRAK